ncbi:hypothetical protein L3Q82_007352 [Scortum barcoo]|uniref:Uncharacterized protein n=1 Tax=Scortum barcoo TaxID=214431 RepID=A0ACB8WT64_9TELE|nr:hypothetical protein L3Q82_007352 [Scortum barcoo]
MYMTANLTADKSLPEEAADQELVRRKLDGIEESLKKLEGGWHCHNNIQQFVQSPIDSATVTREGPARADHPEPPGGWCALSSPVYVSSPHGLPRARHCSASLANKRQQTEARPGYMTPANWTDLSRPLCRRASLESIDPLSADRPVGPVGPVM